VQLVQ
jgi:hypothetical protein